MNKNYSSLRNEQTGLKGLKGHLLRGAALLILLCTVLPAMAADYVITYTTGGTTYYLGMDNNNQLVAKTTPDATCVWQGYYGGDYSLSTTTRINIRNKNNTSYYLYYDGSSIVASTTTQRRWYGGNGSSIYYSNGGTTRYIHNSGSTITASSSATNAFIPYTVTVTSVASISTNPTISGADVLTATGNSTYTASGAAYRIGYTNYNFNSANHYFDANGNSFTGTPANANITYSWSLTDNAYATVNNSGVVTVSSLPEYDITLTLTVTATATGGTPAAPANTTLTASKEITIQGTKPSAPIISVSGNTATITTDAAGSTSIRYTLDGTEPTASTGTVYSGAIDLSTSTTSPVTIKAVTVRNGNASDVSTEVVTLTLPTPVITANGSAGTATITCGIAGATIYYTTDGSTPTTSSSSYTTGLTGLAVMTTIKAIAVKDGWNNSAIASTTLTIPSGVSNGVVTLFDCEPHNWAYYSDENCPVHRLNPADVKITYRGYGDNTMTSTNTDVKPANAQFNQNVASSAVQVNKNEAGHTFIYYKTLENANEAGTGNYPYTMIPNPFQVRPTYNGDWRGFYAWRVNSLSAGLSIKVGNTTYTSSNISSGIIIYAEQEVEFITSNATGNEVVFEALWAKAYLNSNTYYSNDGDYRNAYERNFKTVTQLSTYTYPVTISSINPDGSGNVGSVTRTSNYTCTQDVKLENMTLNMSNYYFNGDSYNLTIGRGVANGNNNLATSVYGDYSPNSVRTPFTLRIESGKYSSDLYVFYAGGNTKYNNTACIATFILGSDYDRAKNDNSKLTISGEVDMGGNGYYCSNANSRINTYVLSGTIGAGADNKELYMGFVNSGSACNTVRKLEVFGGVLQNGIAGGIEGGSVSTANPNMTMRVRGGTINRFFYGAGQHSPAYGNKRIVVTGGSVTTWISAGAYGTDNTEGNTEGDIELYFGGRANQTNNDGIFGAGYGNYSTGNDKYTVHASNVVFADEATTTGSVYGGGNNGYAKNDIKVYIAGGRVAGDVYGGANQARSEGSVSVTVTKGTVVGGVYGGSNTSGAISGQITVDVYGTDDHPGDGTYAIGAVFGGGNQANYTGTPNVTVHGNCTGTEKDISIGEVYGGGNLATVTNTNVAIYGGDTIGAVYAGAKGTLNSTTVMCTSATLNVYGGTIKRVFPGNNFGGYIGTNNNGTVTTTINASTVEGGSTHCPLQIGALFHGGNQASSKFRPVTITCTGAESEGIDTLFGGANQANITSDISLSVDNGNIRHAIFGGNNTSGTVQGDIVLDILKPTTSTASCYSAAKWPTVFGGGFGTATKVAGDVTVNIGKKTNDSDAAPTIAGDVYGGSAMGNVNSEANNTSDTTAVNIFNGIVEGNVYGGGLGDKQSLGAGHINANAKVYGNVTVNIGDRTANTSTPTVQGYVFGCNNTNGSPQQNVAVHIYRTAHPTAATERGTYADMDDFNTFLNTAAAHATTSFALQAVYGGGNKADYTPATAGKGTSVYIHNCDNTVKMVYGGGRAADVGVSGGITANTSITVDGGRIDTLFSGGDGHTTSDGLPKSESNTYLSANIYGNANAAVHGGYYTAVFGASNTSGTISGDKNMVIDKTIACAEKELIGTLFGGSNLANLSGNAELTIECGAGEFNEIYGGCNLADITGNVTLNLYGGTFNNVFGGSKGTNDNAANISGNVTLNLYGGTMVNAFGGSNINGNIAGKITVNVLDVEGSCPLVVENVYGSGNLTAYTPSSASLASPEVNIIHINNSGNGVSGDVFGGGLGLTATVNANPVVNIGYDATTQSSLKPAGYSEPTGFPKATVGNNVYGGGSLASVHGNTNVNIRTSNTVIWNTVYGAGKGDTVNPDAAIVKGNATVVIDNGNVRRSVYGGGELSSVGTFTYYPSTVANSSSLIADGHVKGEPASATAGTGITSVYIKGGVIGLLSNNRMPNPTDPTIEDDYGYIFCAGKGIADSTIVDGEGVPYANRLAVVDSTYLEISGGIVTASVYGGSENGEVLRNTHVKITGGQIGEGFDPENTTWDGVYDEADWTTVINKVKDGTFTDADAAGFHFCDAWPFNAEGTRYTYDHYATYYNSTDKQYYYDAGFTKPSYNGSNRAGDGHSYFGHVFGGGSGYYPFKAGVWRRSAGRVKGDTYVEITGGHILTNIYGGNEITDVLGKSKVEMTGGTLGVPRRLDSIQARPVNCNLFGAGMGDPRIMFNQWSNVGSTEVIVGDSAVIFGSVFGGGEDGHVLGDASTTIKGKAVIGTNGGSGLDGNVYGGGRGYSTWALTAGVVSGNVTLTIQDTATIHGSIYGGGRLAAVGTYLVPADSSLYGEMQSGTGHGNIAINITGGTIGNSHQMGGADHSVGDVFGGSKGILGLDVARDQKLGLAKNTTINISQATGRTTHILGNVYGGGEIASVGHYNYADADDTIAFMDAHKGEIMYVGDVYDTIVPSPKETVGLATIAISGGTIGTEAAIGNASQVAAYTHREAGHTLYRKGSVFGGCLGMAGTDYSGYSFVTNSKVTISDTAMVMASVFGGGENGHVFNCTDVRIEGGQVGQELEASEHEEDDNGVGKVEDIFFGNVYGGGRGIDTYRDHGVEYHSVTAGRVGDSANVTMTAGRVTHNIYGGGSLATVGYKDEQNSGTATVSITGGIVGYADGHTTFNDNGDYSYDGTDYANLSSANKELVKNFYKYAGNNEGNVYGSGRGHAGQNISDQYVQMAFTKNTDVTIGGNAQVRGSVFGGGENGHVRKDTKVTIAGTAQIGVPLMSAVDWGDAQWRVSPDGYVSWDTLSNGTLSEAYYQNESYGPGIHLHEHWIGDNGEGPTIYRGNVYGGGRGVTPTDPENNVSIDAHNYSATAGRVYGNATVEVTGGHIYHDLFGGGSLASVGTLVYRVDTTGGVTKYYDPMGNEITGQFTFRQSKTSADSGWHDTTTVLFTRPYYLGDAVTGTGLATVIVRGGVIGTRGINEGSVFGSGRGIAGAISSSVAHLANANNTYVSIRSGADIRGAVFGGGANGHVKEDTYVEMTGGTVGVMLPLAVRKIDERTGHGYRNYNGNVYGGGRGVSVVASTVGGSTQHLSETAGRVFGNTRVKISGGQVYHSVFGGGSLASVGDYSYKLWNDGDTHRYRHLFVQGTGQAVVHITGDAVIGNAAEALERPLSEYNANDALTAQYVLRTEIDNAEWHDLSAAAAETKWNGLSPDQKLQMFTELNYHYLGSNSGMVFGSGRGVGALHNNTIDDDYVNSAFTRNTIVVVDNDGNKIPVICGSVFGGGENGHVKINTHVDINGGIIGGIPLHDTAFYPGRAANNGIDGNDTYKFSNDANLKLSLEYEDNEDNAGHGPAVYRGNVYGGGRGVDHTDALRPEIGYSATAGRVYGDSEVEITGGVIYHHVFGGGSLASVGTYLFYEDGTPYRVDSLYEYKLVAYDAGHTLSAKRDPGKYAVRRAGFREDGSEPDTMYVLAHEDPGAVYVTVSGGQVGVTGINEGSVFGGGRGIAGQSSDMVTLMAYCYTTDVKIKPGAKVRGSVFGGGANGHVLTDSKVTMTGGTVGATLSDAERAINSFGEANIKVYHGNVYGGGRGVDPISSGTGHNLSYTAGRVYGDASVNITGGTVLHNVYGGGSLATVGTILYRKNAGDPAPGTSLAPVLIDEDDPSLGYFDAHGTPQANTGSTSVTIGGTAIIGTDGMNNGSVFGSCRGVAGPGYFDRAYVYNTTVTIDTGTDGKPFIHGSVFGSGENGHVQNNTLVTINGGTIGSDISSIFTAIDEGTGDYDGFSADQKAAEKKKYNYIGNVYGAGRGVDAYKDANDNDAYSYSAGYVRNNTTVNINGGTIYRNVYGGGSMGLVGDYGPTGALDDIASSGNDPVTGKPIVTSGLAKVNIHSNVGTSDNVDKGYGGCVFGSSRGQANDPTDPAHHDFADMAYVFKTLVNIGDSAGNEGLTVYGNVYGGGEAGHVDWGGTTVNILSGTVNGSVFGGGMGASTSPTAGIVDGPTQVNIGLETQGSNNVIIGGNVFGGNDAGSSPLGEMRVDVWHTAHPGSTACPTLPVRTDYATDEAYQTAYDAAVATLNASAATAENYALQGVYGGGNKASTLTGHTDADAPGWTGASETYLNTKYITQRLDPSHNGNSAWPGDTSRLSKVVIHGCSENTVMYVYGGGRAANTLHNDVLIEGGRIYRAFAGGDGHTLANPSQAWNESTNPYLPANVKKYTSGITSSGDASLVIEGGIVYQAFGGSNTSGTVEGTASVIINPEPTCDLLNDEIFGGGNQAPGNGEIIVTIPCGTKGLTDVYGGSNQADFTGNVTLNILGGTMERAFGGAKNADIKGNVTVNAFAGHIGELFGGNNAGGYIFGDNTTQGNITVNVDFNNEQCPGEKHIDFVYGGGNNAPYKPDGLTVTTTDNEHTINANSATNNPARVSPVVNIISDYSTVVAENTVYTPIVDSAVFGGGKGSTAVVKANPKVVIGADRVQELDGNLKVVEVNPAVSNLHVTIGTHDNTDGGLQGNVFGGGNAAAVEGNTTVNVRGNRTLIHGNVYGGGNAAAVDGNTNVYIGEKPE